MHRNSRLDFARLRSTRLSSATWNECAPRRVSLIRRCLRVAPAISCKPCRFFLLAPSSRRLIVARWKDADWKILWKKRGSQLESLTVEYYR